MDATNMKYLVVQNGGADRDAVFLVYTISKEEGDPRDNYFVCESCGCASDEVEEVYGDGASIGWFYVSAKADPMGDCRYCSECMLTWGETAEAKCAASAEDIPRIVLEMLAEIGVDLDLLDV